MHATKLLLVVLATTFAYSLNPTSKVVHPKQKQSQSSTQPESSDQRGTEQLPLVIKEVVPPKTQDETEQEAKDRDQKTLNDKHVVWFNGMLALVGFLQLLVFGYQAYKLRETVTSAGEQSKAMERHIGEAYRSANAMEEIAAVINKGNIDITRAYLPVSIGTAIYQERRPGQTDLKFEARPFVLNNGNTPAKKVITRVRADILPFPLPQDLNFPLPDAPVDMKGNFVGPRQQIYCAGTVDRFVNDNDVSAIKEAVGQALYVWGLLTYKDIFETEHFTRFAHIMQWYPNGTVQGFFLDGQNDGD